MESYVIGYYNEYRYSVRLFTDKNPNGDDIYNAGNSPYDSQISTAHGVGLAKMKEYCEMTTKMLAIEHKARYAGIEKDEDEPNEFLVDSFKED
jgi:hypothetical protein